MLGEHVVTLTAEGLTEQTAVNGAFSAWVTVKDVQASNTHIFIFMKATGAHVIPVRAFARLDEAVAFRDFAMEHTRAANAVTARPSLAA
jgi:hypothetical protein